MCVWMGPRGRGTKSRARTISLSPQCGGCNRAARNEISHLVTKPIVACAPSEDSDQPGHPPSLIRVFAVRMKKAWIVSYPLSAQRRLWSDWADAQADLSLRWAHMPLCWFCHEVAQLLLSLLFPVGGGSDYKWLVHCTGSKWHTTKPWESKIKRLKF